MDPLVLDTDTKGQLSVVDIFAGPGGMGEGFREAGFLITAAIDNEKYACETLRLNAGRRGTRIIQDDMRRAQLKGRADVVVGGPPCQGFSMVGRPKIRHLRRADGKSRFVDRRNSLYKHFVTAVVALRPQFFVMENVPGLLSYQDGRVAKQIIRDFEAAGYRTAVGVLNAADYGVPQTRKRAFFIGNRIGATNPFPPKTHTGIGDTQLRLDEQPRLDGYVTVRDAISDLPALDPGQGSDEAHYPAPGRLSDYQRTIREGSPMLYNHTARFHSERDRSLFRMLKEGEKMSDLPEELRPYRDDIFKDKIKKQSWDRPSSAILAHLQKDGLMYVHPDLAQARTFTPREAARLQSFPDRFRFCGPMTQQFRQIGNAVPPLLAKHIAMAIKPVLRPREYPLAQHEILTA